MKNKEKFKTLVTNFIDNAKKHLYFAKVSDVKHEIVSALEKNIDIVKQLQDYPEILNLSNQYIDLFTNDFNSLSATFLFPGLETEQILNNETIQKEVKINLEAFETNILTYTNKINENIIFFSKFNFLNSNLVIVGANGSGKTSLSNHLKKFIDNNGLMISAQRILLVPHFRSIDNFETTSKELKASQLQDKTNKNHNEINGLQNEFSILLRNLLSENNSISNMYRKNAKDASLKKETINSPPSSNLDKTLDIWNSLIEHRKINCDDGINIFIEYETGKPYPIMQGSDGEKVILFLIAQVLQAPKNGFIIIDEPEMYLHKSIVNKLWDALESERDDCIFVYLTHDLDFASTRISSRKLWIKSYNPPANWLIEKTEENELPESLFLELLGSRKSILFCEGEKGSIDEKIYSRLYPNFTVTPVGTCFNVINYTKAFNKQQYVNTKAFGIIDSDYHDEDRLNKLKLDNIYSISVCEPENLLLTEEFLILIAKHFFCDILQVEKIKNDILSKLREEIELQISNYLSTKVNNYFKDSDITKGNTFIKLEENLELFTNKIKLNDWYSERETLIHDIIEKREYEKAISIYNNKGLKQTVHKNLELSNFIEKALNFLDKNQAAREIVNKLIPNIDNATSR